MLDYENSGSKNRAIVEELSESSLGGLFSADRFLNGAQPTLSTATMLAAGCQSSLLTGAPGGTRILKTGDTHALAALNDLSALGRPTSVISIVPIAFDRRSGCDYFRTAPPGAHVLCGEFDATLPDSVCSWIVRDR